MCFAQRAWTALRACSERASGVRRIRALVAFRAFLALLAAFLGVLMRPRATAARFFGMAVGSIAQKMPLDMEPNVR